MKDKIITTLVLLIFLLSCIIIYFSTQAHYYKKELNQQKTKYEILIKEPRMKNIIESGG